MRPAGRGCTEPGFRGFCPPRLDRLDRPTDVRVGTDHIVSPGAGIRRIVFAAARRHRGGGQPRYRDAFRGGQSKIRFNRKTFQEEFVGQQAELSSRERRSRRRPPGEGAPDAKQTAAVACAGDGPTAAGGRCADTCPAGTGPDKPQSSDRCTVVLTRNNYVIAMDGTRSVDFREAAARSTSATAVGNE